jgi:hypothetical protein
MFLECLQVFVSYVNMMQLKNSRLSFSLNPLNVSAD